MAIRGYCDLDVVFDTRKVLLGGFKGVHQRTSVAEFFFWNKFECIRTNPAF